MDFSFFTLLATVYVEYSVACGIVIPNVKSKTFENKVING